MTAIMVPGCCSEASRMRRPRVATRASASSRSRAPAATRALNSPRLWPATKAGRRRGAPASRGAARQGRGVVGALEAELREGESQHLLGALKHLFRQGKGVVKVAAGAHLVGALSGEDDRQAGVRRGREKPFA